MYDRENIAEPVWMASARRCGCCGRVFVVGDVYGICDQKMICYDCADTEWFELTAAEKFDVLGYDPQVLA